MFARLKKYYLPVILFLILGPVIVYALGVCDEGWRVNHGEITGDIDCHTVCKRVQNTHGSNDYFIPTRSSEEWLKFRQAVPSLPDLNLLECCSCSWQTGSWQDVGACGQCQRCKQGEERIKTLICNHTFCPGHGTTQTESRCVQYCDSGDRTCSEFHQQTGMYDCCDYYVGSDIYDCRSGCNNCFGVCGETFEETCPNSGPNACQWLLNPPD